MDDGLALLVFRVPLVPKSAESDIEGQLIKGTVFRCGKAEILEEGRTRVIWDSGIEVLRAVLHLLVDSYATCGSCLLRMDNSVMSEGLLAGCRVQVLRRLRGGARMGTGIGSNGVGGGTSLGNGNV